MLKEEGMVRALFCAKNLVFSKSPETDFNISL